MFNFISNLLNSIRYYDTIVHLAKLSDEELAHLDLKRSEIVHVALKQYWRHYGLSTRAFH